MDTKLTTKDCRKHLTLQDHKTNLDKAGWTDRAISEIIYYLDDSCWGRWSKYRVGSGGDKKKSDFLSKYPQYDDHWVRIFGGPGNGINHILYAVISHENKIVDAIFIGNEYEKYL